MRDMLCVLGGGTQSFWGVLVFVSGFCGRYYKCFCSCKDVKIRR